MNMLKHKEHSVPVKTRTSKFDFCFRKMKLEHENVTAAAILRHFQICCKVRLLKICRHMKKMPDSSLAWNERWLKLCASPISQMVNDEEEENKRNSDSAGRIVLLFTPEEGQLLLRAHWFDTEFFSSPCWRPTLCGRDSPLLDVYRCCLSASSNCSPQCLRQSSVLVLLHKAAKKIIGSLRLERSLRSSSPTTSLRATST